MKKPKRSEYERVRLQTVEMIQRAMLLLSVQGGGRITGTNQTLAKR